ncbi:hypothetical protein P154DRAFT_520339 [Amniculicola lignicola CBS 123094]|uniref:Uncharacterized protein n=1 Tax=Amniculicola lignicola CBS 123094 TaxID=1392246 RepID=A0A6A5WZL6_9PLEO|nr:hypothetical protein P154DRAFT_520339 [Amniculicola lignicola CBS 123094]
MPPYQHIFRADAVLNVWRNLRNTRDQNDLLLTFHYPGDAGDARRAKYGDAWGKGTAVENAGENGDVVGKKGGKDGGKGNIKMGDKLAGKSMGFVVPWRSMQTQKRELREKEKELAEALVVLAGEVAFTDLSQNLQISLTNNPLIQIRHLCVGISRQLSIVDLQMADNAPFSQGKNLYTGGEIARKFLPTITTLFNQRPAPQRMIFELLMELKDLVYAGMAGCNEEVLEWEVGGFDTFEELDEVFLKCLTPVPIDADLSSRKKRLASRSVASLRNTTTTSWTDTSNTWLSDPSEIYYHLESLSTTSAALSHLKSTSSAISVSDFAAKSMITLRRLLSRHDLTSFELAKKQRKGRCAEYARCMKWAGVTWRQGGGCRRGCSNEDEDPSALPSWHRSSRWFVEDGEGTKMVGNGETIDRKALRDNGNASSRR